MKQVRAPGLSCLIPGAQLLDAWTCTHHVRGPGSVACCSPYAMMPVLMMPMLRSPHTTPRRQCLSRHTSVGTGQSCLMVRARRLFDETSVRAGHCCLMFEAATPSPGLRVHRAPLFRVSVCAPGSPFPSTREGARPFPSTREGACPQLQLRVERYSNLVPVAISTRDCLKERSVGSGIHSGRLTVTKTLPLSPLPKRIAGEASLPSST